MNYRFVMFHSTSPKLYLKLELCSILFHEGILNKDTVRETGASLPTPMSCSPLDGSCLRNMQHTQPSKMGARCNGWTKTIDLMMLRRVYYHCATTLALRYCVCQTVSNLHPSPIFSCKGRSIPLHWITGRVLHSIGTK